MHIAGFTGWQCADKTILFFFLDTLLNDCSLFGGELSE